MRILGLSYGYHDSAAALLQDGTPVFFSNEERFSGNKNDPRFPAGSLAYIRDRFRIGPADVDAIAFYEDPVLRLDRIGRVAAENAADEAAYYRGVYQRWRQRETPLSKEMIADRLGVPASRIHCIRHHRSHAALAYFMSPFQEALVVTLDGIGEYETLTVWTAKGRALTQIASMELPHSVGLLYSTITSFCGFQVNEGEYKLMGLAAFGKPSQADHIREWVSLTTAATRCHTETLNWLFPEKPPFSDAFIERFGPPFEKGRDDILSARFADLAASVQLVVEEEIETLIAGYLEKTGMDAVCLGGGVALNCNVNGRLRRGVCRNLYVPTSPGDAGSALGAALACHHDKTGTDAPGAARPYVPPSPFLGGELLFDAKSIRSPVALGDTMFEGALDTIYAPLVKHRPLPADRIAEEVARMLADGMVVGHMSGRFEMGPRALGNRSILADPRNLDMKERINALIKHRETFRPFAPMVLEEEAERYFEIPDMTALGAYAPERYMLATHPATDLGRECAPAAVHVDGTARVQVINREASPRIHAILTAFRDLTGVPVILNTSLNVAGSPMASFVWSGLQAFLDSGMDALVVDSTVVTRR